MASEQLVAVEMSPTDASVSGGQVWVGPHITELTISEVTEGVFIPGPAEGTVLCS